MGIVAAFPQRILLDLVRAFPTRLPFIETGTFHGDTTRWAAQHFSHVHTIERSEELFNSAGPFPRNVTQYLGDSRQVLPRIMDEVHGPKVLWLDGHWSGGGGTAGEDDECPLLDELLSVTHEDIVLIDDARLFLCAPPAPHHPGHWPTIAEVMDCRQSQTYVQVIDDVIFIVPLALTTLLCEYAQARSNTFWSTFAELQRSKS